MGAMGIHGPRWSGAENESLLVGEKLFFQVFAYTNENIMETLLLPEIRSEKFSGN